MSFHVLSLLHWRFAHKCWVLKQTLVELHLFFEVSLDYLILGKTMKVDYVQSEIDDAIKILMQLKQGL